jgi:hypothetical protein
VRNRGLTERQTSPQNVQALRACGARIWRNNKGAIKRGGAYVPMGLLAPGSSDHIGFLPIRITPEMVGKFVACFVALENKREKGGVIKPEQQAFIDGVLAAGGIAGVATRYEEAREIVQTRLRELGAA